MITIDRNTQAPGHVGDRAVPARLRQRMAGSAWERPFAPDLQMMEVVRSGAALRCNDSRLNGRCRGLFVVKSVLRKIVGWVLP